MKIGFICKYPPITGGVTSRTYWLTRALADRGHEIHIITNAEEVETPFKERLNKRDMEVLKNHENIHIHSTSSEDSPEIRPQYNPFEVKLATLALKVFTDHQLEIIDSWFLLPNAVAGFMVNRITGLPWVLRHGGSDLGKHLTSKHFDFLLKEVIKKADKIITHKKNQAVFKSIGIPGEKMWYSAYSRVNGKYFNNAVRAAENIPGEKPVIMAIGKISREKGTYDLLKSFIPLKDRALLVFVTGGPCLERLKKRALEWKIGDSVKIYPPIAPWQVPRYIRAATCVVHVERQFVIPHYPIIPREVVACKKCLLLSEEMYEKYKFFKRDKNVFVINPHDHINFSKILEKIIDNEVLRNTIEENAFKTSIRVEKYEEYIDRVEDFYETLL